MVLNFSIFLQQLFQGKFMSFDLIIQLSQQTQHFPYLIHIFILANKIVNYISTIGMNKSVKITRDQFIQSVYLKITLIDIQKNLLHHNRYVIEVILDRNTVTSKKKFTEVKKFSQQLDSRFGFKQFVMDNHMRSSEQYKEIQILFKKLNATYLAAKETDDEKIIQKKTQIRNYLYNMLFCIIDQLHSSEEQIEIKNSEKDSKKSIETFVDSKAKEEISKGLNDKDRERSDVKDLRDVLKNIYKPKRDTEDLRKNDFLKLIKTIWVEESGQWSQKTYALTENALVLYEKDEQTKQIIVMKRLSVTLNEDKYYKIVINHELFIKPILLRLSHLSQSNEDESKVNLYLTLFTSLKQISYKNDYNIYNFVGIRINNKKNKIVPETQKKPAKELTFKMTHQNQTIIFSMLIDSTTYLQIPIINNYGKIDLQITQCRQLTILSNFRESSINISLPVQNIYDQLFNQKPKKKTPQMKYHMLQSKQSNYMVKFDYFERANRNSYYSCKVKDKFQGEEVPAQFTRDQFRIQKNRFKRVVYSIEEYINYVKILKNFQYPLQSYIFYFLLFCSIFLFDANYLLHYSISLICIVLMYCHPTCSSYYRQLICILGLTQSVDLFTRKLKQRANVAIFEVNLKKDIEKKLFLQQFVMTSKNKRNIYKKYKRLQQILLRGQLLLTEFVTFSQKIKNTFLWYHHKKTKQLLLLLLVSLAIVIFIPIRLMLLGLLYKMYNKGIDYRMRVKNINRVILYQIFKLCIQQNNFGEIKGYLTQNTKPIDKKSSEYQSFQKKLKDYLSQILQIQYDNEIFVQSKNIHQMIGYLSDCRKRFVIPEQICEKYKFNMEWSVNINTITRLLLVVYGFLINIPSDRSILGIKQVEVEKGEVENQSEDDDN